MSKYLGGLAPEPGQDTARADSSVGFSSSTEQQDKVENKSELLTPLCGMLLQKNAKCILNSIVSRDLYPTCNQAGDSLVICIILHDRSLRLCNFPE